MTAPLKVSLSGLRKELVAASSPERATGMAWFFKTGKGQYGEGDRFIGVTVPAQRKIAVRYRKLPLRDVGRLLESPIHEHRFTALEILVLQYEAGDTAAKQAIFDFYLEHAARINNWDLVDTSAPYIVGEHLASRPRQVLYRLAKSENVWERRIAVVATLTLIRAGDLGDIFAIARLLLADRHDLIQKAVGWMLREAGKRSKRALLDFLRTNYSRIPRTSWRYSIERFPQAERNRILKGLFSGRGRNAG